MAAVSNVSLSITDGSTTETKTVAVSGTLTFEESDIGKNYRLAIKLFGEDLDGDNLPNTDPAGDDELYTFMFGSFFKSLYKSITVAAAGSQSFTELRTISKEKLDEDSGNILVKPPVIGLPPVKLPRTDEVYAKVTLSVAPYSSTARSATVTGFY
uniref:hypothetical protein n=1 Tax=Candidatus Electronema sp. TaxID=2698783 RepID=UPI004055C8CE